MANSELEEFSRSLWDSLAEADRRLIEEKAGRGETLVYSTLEGIIYHIEARELLKMKDKPDIFPTSPSTDN